jgi:tape measure domain-containing protein
MASNNNTLAIKLMLIADELKQGLADARKQLDALKNAGAGAGQKAAADAKKSLNDIASTANNAKNALIGFFGVNLGFDFAKKLIADADKWLMLNAQIRNATDSAAEFAVSQQAIIDISRKTYTSLEANAVLFSKINLAIKAMGGESSQAISTVDQIAKLVALSGTSAEAAAAGIFQFSQSLASNRFSGQEYNSVAEQTPALLKAIYEGLNVNIGTLRKMAEEGALDTATVLSAIEKSTARTNAAFTKLPITFAKASQNMANAWLEFIGRLNETEGVTATLGAGINYLADNIGTLGDYALKFLAIGLVAGLSKIAVGLVETSQAMRLSSLEAKANAVANAQLQAAEEARIATLYAEVAAQKADIQAKIADTEATIAVTQAEIRSTQAMIANAATLQAKAALVSRITVLNAEMAASQAVLVEQQTALNVVQTQGNLTLREMASATTLLSAGIAGVVGWEIGSWARESSVWVEKLGVGFAALFTTLLTPIDFLKNPAEYAKGWIDQFNAVGDESIKDLAIRKEAEKQATKDAIANEEVKVKAIADGIKKSQAKLDALNTVRKTSYEQDLRNLDQAEQAKLAALNNALPERLAVEEKYQSTKQVISKQAGLSEQQLLVQKTAIEIQANNQRLALAKQYNEQKLADTTRVFDAEIATMRGRNLATDQLEKESNDAKKAILGELEKSYEASITKLIALDQQHRTKAIGYLNDINAQEQNRLTQLRALDATGLNDAQATEQRKRQIAEDTAQVKKLIAAGEYADAVALSKKLQDLTFQQAQTTKQAAADANKAQSGSGNDFAAKEARDQYNASVNLTTQALQGAADAETKQANIAKTETDKQRLSLEEVRKTIADIDTAITKGNTLKVTVDTTEVDAAKKSIDEIPTDKTVTIHTVEAHAAGGLVGAVKRAAGGVAGYIRGAGTTTSDSIAAWLSNKEYVVKASSVEKLGVGTLDYINQTGSIPAFSTGGSITPAGFMPSLGSSQTTPSASSSDTVNINLSLNGNSAVGVFQKNDAVNQLINAMQQQQRASRG